VLGNNTTGCREEGEREEHSKRAEGRQRGGDVMMDAAGEEEVKTKLNRKEEGKNECWMSNDRMSVRSMRSKLRDEVPLVLTMTCCCLWCCCC